MNDPSPRPGRARAQFLLLAALFVAPLAAAMLLFFVFPDWIPEDRVNNGTLVDPPRAASALDLRDADGVPVSLSRKWSLVLVAVNGCDESCEQRLYLTRQVRTALHKHHERVQRVYVAADAAAMAAAQARFGAEHPDLLFARDAGQPGDRATDFFGSAAPPEAVYLVDPLGNWMMSYPGELDPKGLHRDLKRLLKYAQSG